MQRYALHCGVLLGLVLLGACTQRPPQVARCTALGDNATQHVVRAMEALEADRLEVARGSVERALGCDETYAPAYTARALLYAVQAASHDDDAYRQTDTGRALEALEQAEEISATPEARFIYHTTAIRVFTHLQGEDWLAQAEQHFQDSQELSVDENALPYYRGREAATYFMGLAAFRGAHDVTRARALFRQVLDAKRGGRWHEPANTAWRQADKVARATAGITIGDVGRKIAIQTQVSRGDLAVLLVNELKIEQLFAGRIPVEAEVNERQAAFTPADITQHPFKPAVLALMKWQVRGLEPRFDQTTQAYLFQPDQPVTRKELAIVLEDVLIKLSGDETLASKFLGQDSSPFPDVQPTVAWFNAVMTVVTRDLMEAELSGEFRPDRPADGAEVLLALRVLQQRLNLS